MMEEYKSDIVAWFDRNINSRRAPILGIERHRIETYGEGVTTLIGFYGCPLKSTLSWLQTTMADDFC